MSAEVFPVVGEPVRYASRFTREHRGVDIFAPLDSPVLAPATGRAELAEGDRAGLAVRVVEPDGTRYMSAHLSGYAGEYPRQVTAGDLLGYVGTTGNAVGREPHVHFEYRPFGGDVRDPVPMLDALKAGETYTPSRGGGWAFFGIVIVALGIYSARKG